MTLETLPTYYKFLNLDGTCWPGGTGHWYLPRNGRPGKWMPTIEGNLVPCERGYHILEEADLVHWLGPTLWTVERGKQYIRHLNKGVTERARTLMHVSTWNERTAQLFIADCAEHVLHLFESKYPADPRPRQAIAAARAFARGEANLEDLDTATAAATAAVIATAAVEAAIWTAATAAAVTAERDWQTTRLMEYLRGERE